jgi:phosphoribosylaminoimidazole-succinocarboxamide synthase
MKSGIKLFEAFYGKDYLEHEFRRYDSDVDFYKTVMISPAGLDKEKLDRLSRLGLANTIAEIEDISFDTVKITYEMKPYFDNAGIHDIDLILRTVYIAGEYTIWDEAKQEETRYDFEIEDAGPFDGRVQAKWGTLPIYPKNIEIVTPWSTISNGVQTKHPFDPTKPDASNFKYEIEIGE